MHSIFKRRFGSCGEVATVVMMMFAIKPFSCPRQISWLTIKMHPASFFCLLFLSFIFKERKLLGLEMFASYEPSLPTEEGLGARLKAAWCEFFPLGLAESDPCPDPHRHSCWPGTEQVVWLGVGAGCQM